MDVSKLLAEQRLADLSLDWVALRLPLVFGPGVTGNMATLLKLARSPFPLPFGSLRAQRSLISLENLMSAVTLLLDTPQLLRRPLIAADPTPLTIPEMIAAMRAGLGRPSGLLPLPQAVLRAALRIAGRPALYRRLAEPLVASPARLVQMGWNPSVSTRDALAALARADADPGE
jgi:nucleoside-diphosphate-sugar epimerase